METSSHATAVSSDGRFVIFKLLEDNREVEGVIARGALEECFWLPRGADEMRMLKTFEDGRARILAVARRKLRAQPDRRLSLHAEDFRPQ